MHNLVHPKFHLLTKGFMPDSAFLPVGNGYGNGYGNGNGDGYGTPSIRIRK